MSDASASSLLAPTDDFARRHLGPGPADLQKMLASLGYASLDAMSDDIVPESIRLSRPLALDAPRSESEALALLRTLAAKNKVHRSFLGTGYYDTFTPPVILRNVLENPGWYTQYTPYQAEISQGRLEALLNFQTMVSELTGLPLAGASLLDEGTAAAEAMGMCVALAGDDKRKHFFVSDRCHPQTLAVVQTRAAALGVEVLVGDALAASTEGLCGVLVQYPETEGTLRDWRSYCEKMRAAGVMVVMATDLLALLLLASPGELGADVAVGSAQRFGVPMGYGGPHAGFLATRNEYARRMPGRIIGVSKDAQGHMALRMALQTREQHIRREKATSNICTAQALLAIIAGLYAAWHGPHGLRRMATRVRALTVSLERGLRKLGVEVLTQGPLFDTLRARVADSSGVVRAAEAQGMNLRDFGDGTVGASFDETTTAADVRALWGVFAAGRAVDFTVEQLLDAESLALPENLARKGEVLAHPVFNTYHSETDMLRYLTRLQSRDLSLANAMIPLGSCTMKLNATSEMIPVTWPEFGRMHPFCPPSQARGYAELFAQLEGWLAEITGFRAVSLQPNAGSQGEYAGLLVVRAYHEARGDKHRDVCLIPDSAHGTNPASAVLAGFRVVAVKCDAQGNIDLKDLEAKAAQHAEKLGALMVTYPSTHGVFEETIREVCKIVHAHGGQVYMDGANMNAQVGLCSPGDIGADVCHLNLHKTFCIPHGGGGPGMGPICVAEHLAPFLPTHPVQAPASAGKHAVGPVSAAPYGSPSILVISWMYIAMMGGEGLKRATQVAILNANYMAKRLEGAYKVLYTGRTGRCAHEFILDCRGFEQSAGVKVDDLAKRLMDYSFHAPTMSWPVPGTLMIEPTESEPLSELDRLCDALLAIREEVRAIEEGRLDRKDNPLRNAPHTVAMVSADEWTHPYGREQAAFPLQGLRSSKFWPPVARVDNTYGDRNLVCLCPPMSEYQ